MKPRIRASAIAAVYLISGYAFASGTASPAPSPEYRRSSLLERTPFAKNEKGAGKPAAAGPLELRGFYGSGAALEVSLTRPDTKEASWVKVGDTAAKWVVESADPVAGTAEVRYDGLRLHLTLARPEEVVIPAPEAKVEEPPENKSRNRGNRANLSPEARDAMRSAMREGMDAARKEHPEYFDGSKLSDEQQKARSEYMKANFEKVREAVAKVSPDEAAKLQGFGDRGEHGGRNNRSEGAGVGLQIGNSAPAATPAPINP